MLVSMRIGVLVYNNMLVSMRIGVQHVSFYEGVLPLKMVWIGSKDPMLQFFPFICLVPNVTLANIIQLSCNLTLHLQQNGFQN